MVAGAFGIFAGWETSGGEDGKVAGGGYSGVLPDTMVSRGNRGEDHRKAFDIFAG
ncbi:MAG: hypothetical protein ABI876_02280 [Bacteroidota bacterium]